MRTRTMRELKKCDFCKRDSKVIIDAPTIMGPWASMCEACAAENGRNIEIGTKFVLAEKKEGLAKPQVLRGKELSTLETIVMDGDREVACPSCGDVKSVEPDAEGQYTCDSCGQKYTIRSRC